MSKNNPTIVLLALLLLLASFLATMLIFVRESITGSLEYTFLVWNLFLAWVPLFLSLLVRFWQKRPFLRTFAAFIWLLFMPNTFYLVTDIKHLYPHAGVRYWFDLLLLFSFAAIGVLLGVVSLFLMQSLVTKRFGQRIGWLFAMVMMSLIGYGVYIGRFRRWNSWDLFTHPGYLLRDIVATLFHPNLMRETLAAWAMFTAVFAFGYIILVSLPVVMHGDPS